MEEYCTLFPYLVPISKRDYKERDKLIPQIIERIPSLKI
jgi:hypothetical protein